jgi:hypothetical protein
VAPIGLSEPGAAGAAGKVAAAPIGLAPPTAVWAKAVCKGNALKLPIRKTKPKRRVGENEFIELNFFGKTKFQATAMPIVLIQYTATLGF